LVKNKVILIVRDGWGYSEETDGNAVNYAYTPNNDRYLKTYSWTLLKCTGEAVGLPKGLQGSSEPGHLTIGAGRIIPQLLIEINHSIKDGSFYKNQVFLDTIENCKKNCSKLHLMGIHSAEGIHGTINHLYALLELAKREEFHDVYVHCFLDGVDSPQRSAERFFRRTQDQINQRGVGRIASLIGRFYAMDRDNNWDRIQKAYNLIAFGDGRKESEVFQAISNAYRRGETDYHIEPIIMVDENEEPIAKLNQGDSVIFWNFRSERARQLTHAFTQKGLDESDRQNTSPTTFVCMSVYDSDLNLPIAFPRQEIQNSLGQVLSENDLSQLRIAEEEMRAHITYFFSGYREDPYQGEERIIVPSLTTSSFDEKPEMSAYKITEQLLLKMREKRHDFILVNYANSDFVGHSGNLQAGIKACEVVDKNVGQVVEAGLEEGYIILITADHGNIETMFYSNGRPNPSHGRNPVPLILISDEPDLKRVKLRSGLGLSSIAPTILSLIGIDRPPDMTATNIILHTANDELAYDDC
jgi:2,3-bisphosphoglycerate-independent phosphoglycerate mutase